MGFHHLRTAADCSTEELLAEMRRLMEADWHIKLKDGLTLRELASLFHAYTEDVECTSAD